MSNVMVKAFEEIAQLADEAKTKCSGSYMVPPEVEDTILPKIRSIAREQVIEWSQYIEEMAEYTEDMEIQDALAAGRTDQAEQLAKDAGYRIVETPAEAYKHLGEDLENINAKEMLFLDPRD